MSKRSSKLEQNFETSLKENIFKHKNEFIWHNILLIVHLRHRGGFIAEGANIVECVIVAVFILLPLIFMQLCIGHITRRGPEVISTVAPILTGINYSMIMLTLLEAYGDIVELRDLLYYLIFSYYAPWMTCFPQISKICIGTGNPSAKSFEKQKTGELKLQDLSAYQYFREFMLKTYTYKQLGIHEIRTIVTARYIILICISLLIYYISKCDFRKNPSIYTITAMIVIFVNFVFVFFTVSSNGAIIGINDVVVRAIDFDYLQVITPWARACSQVFFIYSVASVCIIQYATRLKDDLRTEILANEFWWIIMSIEVIRGATFVSVKGAISYEMNIPISELNMTYEEHIFVAFPQFFGYFKVGSFVLTALLFLVNSLSCLFSLALQISVVFVSICDIKKSFCAYKNYVIGVISCSLCLLAIPLHTKDQQIINFTLGMTDYVTISLIMIFESICVLWFYGVQNLCDDYHFKFGTQPSLFWKVTFWLQPIFLVASLSVVLIDYKNNRTFPKILSSVVGLTVFMFIPQIIALAIQIFKQVKEKNLLLLFRVEESWGDPDPQERAYRRLFPPRRQVRYRRHLEVCRHTCLRYTAIVPLIVSNEEKLRMEDQNIDQT